VGRPNTSVYRNGGRYGPTGVAVNEKRWGGNGDVWLADGYGANYVHRFDERGAYLMSINGQEGGAGAFNCPHGIWVDTRKREPEMYIADRGNCRIQVYDLDGTFKRSFGSDILTSPCGFSVHNGLLLIPELYARVAILDEEDQLVCYLGANEAVCKIKGWPNHLAHLVSPGKFNSPHAMTADRSGNLYVVEWIIGGRITKLTKV